MISKRRYLFTLGLVVSGVFLILVIGKRGGEYILSTFRDEIDYLRKRFSNLIIDEDVIKLERILQNRLDIILSDEELKLPINPIRRCRPQRNIVFLKTHKTGSSTITSILNRYADIQELIVAIPANNTNRFKYPAKFKVNAVDLKRLNGYYANILVNHAIYNREEMDLIMDHQTKYITILRSPTEHFESSYNYFGYNKKTSMKIFFENPDFFFQKFLKKRDAEANLIRNGMFFDLGYLTEEIDNADKVREIIQKLSPELDIVLIMEYFDESLVLLTKIFCWDLDDVVYITQNSRVKKSYLPESTIKKIKQWNWADEQLYQHFNHTFWKKIATYGKEFWEDVSDLKRRNAALRKACSLTEIVERAFQIKSHINSFRMRKRVDRYNRCYCQKTLRSETSYIKYFRLKFDPEFGYQRMLQIEMMRSSPPKELAYFK